MTLRIFLFSCLLIQFSSESDSHQATGVKVGEVSDTSAIVWVRLTARAERRSDGIALISQPGKGQIEALPPGITADDLEGSCPGVSGLVRVSYGAGAVSQDTTEWVEVSADQDFTHQFRLDNLVPNTMYSYVVETKGSPQEVLNGSFLTAPKDTESIPVTFTVITGQAYKDKDRPDGFQIYESMGRLNPHFMIPTGDTVYYDTDPPRATTVDVARYHWHRMYSLPTLVSFHRTVPGYWIKDDHDTLMNDCWPTMDPGFMLPLTFEEGQQIFRDQVPMGEKTFRTFRWGRHLQVWFPEGRDFRSPNDAEDGPGKSIWGGEQKRWLAESILGSDADWKILASATPIVGPDREGKADNHANAAFAWEGDQIRRWIREHAPENLFVVCGDRHWQYESVDPETKVHEFSCGPASDLHAGGIPKESVDRYEWHRVMGGFLSVSVTPKSDGSEIAFRHHDVYGNVVHEFRKEEVD